MWYISASVYFYVLLGDYDFLPTLSEHGGISLNAHNPSYQSLENSFLLKELGIKKKPKQVLKRIMFLKKKMPTRCIFPYRFSSVLLIISLRELNEQYLLDLHTLAKNHIIFKEPPSL